MESSSEYTGGSVSEMVMGDESVRVAQRPEVPALAINFTETSVYNRGNAWMYAQTFVHDTQSSSLRILEGAYEWPITGMTPSS